MCNMYTKRGFSSSLLFRCHLMIIKKQSATILQEKKLKFHAFIKGGLQKRPVSSKGIIFKGPFLEALSVSPCIKAPPIELDQLLSVPS